MQGYLEKRIQTPMAPDRSTKMISMIKWIWTSRLSIKNSLSFIEPDPNLWPPIPNFDSLPPDTEGTLPVD